MRHQKKTVKLGRTAAPRKALFSNLAASLILYEKIQTTEAKAKALRPRVERLITRGKVKNIHNKQQLGRFLGQPKAVKKVLDVLGPRYADRPGGYLRITHMGRRQGDAAPMVQIEFV